MRPGHVDALEEPGGGEQARRLVAAANALTSAGLGRSRWVRIGNDTRPRSAVGGHVHRPPAREQRQRAAAGGGDQRLELVVDRVAERRRCSGSGRCIAQYSSRVRVVVERAADVGDWSTLSAGMPTRAASDVGIVALVRIAVRFDQTPSRIVGPTSSGAISRRGDSGEPDTNAT